jgi:hypothetical protein
MGFTSTWPRCSLKKGVFRLSEKMFLLIDCTLEPRTKEMSRLSFAVLIVLGLMLTSYFGLAAWRASGGDQTETTGTVMPRNR